MVRPKASEVNLRIALSFVDMLIVREKVGAADTNASRVARKGPRSPFAAFRACFPDLARNSQDRYPKNRQAVSNVELNKAMKSTGLRSIRKRDMTEEGVRWLYKVTQIVAESLLIHK